MSTSHRRESLYTESGGKRQLKKRASKQPRDAEKYHPLRSFRVQNTFLLVDMSLSVEA